MNCWRVRSFSPRNLQNEFCKRNFSSTPRSCGLSSWRVTTFDQTKLEAKKQKIINLSNQSHASWLLGTKHRPRFSCHVFYGIDYQPAEAGDRKIWFPNHTKGCFYYFRDVAMPPVSGGIRFRLCNDVNDFNSGHDLRTPVGEPWAIPLIYLVRDKKWLHSIENLIADGLVEESLVKSIKNIGMASKSLRYRPLFLPDQPVYFDLRHRLFAFHLITRKTSSRMLFQHVFHPPHVNCEGRIKLRFEMAENTPEPTLVLRILELLDPIKYPDPFPTEVVKLKAGELLQRRSSNGVAKPWTYELNTRSSAELWKEFLKTCGHW